MKSLTNRLLGRWLAKVDQTDKLRMLHSKKTVELKAASESSKTSINLLGVVHSKVEDRKYVS